ncbi:ectopic P granules protein 5 homolog, partial [Saccoglossus kowalevskii]|uniref:Ectopic P granules protein 5 homolog n=1 Tax=Saccoglossus kowalevskii TaxID=10224 RepID=A0ABM0M970_SACKO
EIWTEFLDKDRVEFEVIQLVSSWVKECKVIHCSDGNRRHSLLTDYSTQSIESRILHRLKQYEPSKPPPSIVPLKSPVPAISDDLLNNSNRMVATLENDIRSLVEYARIFSVREANHIAIDCNYIEVLPDLYYNKPVELNLQVPCKSAYKLSHKCSGPAFLVLRFREMTKNSITARKLDANREEYEQVLQESMSPPPIAVCTAAVHIENAITALIKCIREKPLEEREKLPAFESGARLFYQLIAESDDDIRHYPPTKQFFSSCLEILGQEFILDTVDQSQPLLSAMLDKPVLAGLLAPNFNPNNCIEEFVDMYKQVTKLPHEKSDLAFMLLTKFDVARWLKEYKPILSLRSQLTDIIGLALCLCGQEPELQIQMLFEMYRSHLKLLLMNQFPDHYGDVLRLLLLVILYCHVSDEEFFYCLATLLIKETIEWLTNYFKKLRVSTAELARFGLYSKWRPYIKPLSNFFGFLSQTYIVKEAERVISVGMGIEQDVLPHYSHDALSLFWPYYVNVLSHKGIVEHVLRVCHARFVALPWNSFYPRLDAVELMLKLQDGSPTSCFIFLGSMFSQMNWVEITQHYMRNVSPDIATKLHVCLLLLLIMFSREKTIITTNTAMQALIKKSESFQWAYIDSSSYENVVQWLLSNTDPDTILSQRRCMEDKGLSLLRAAAGFAQNVPVNPDTSVKRCSYIRCVVQMICKCSHQKEIKVESFATAIDDMMQDIESVASVAVDTQAMTSELIDLLTEVLNLLNNCASAGRGIEVVERSLVRWIERSPCSVLILPLITAACRTLASLTHMVLIVETCMDSYFNSGMDLSQFGGWSHVTDKLQVPELTHDEFLEECMKQGAYLTLYAYILQRLPLCQSLNDELNILTKIVDWTTAAKPCDVNEAKLLLWWSKAIELCLRQVDYGAPHQYVIRTINNLAPALHVLGEDKTSAGLLGAIGLGRRSSLSLRYAN